VLRTALPYAEAQAAPHTGHDQEIRCWLLSALRPASDRVAVGLVAPAWVHRQPELFGHAPRCLRSSCRLLQATRSQCRLFPIAVLASPQQPSLFTRNMRPATQPPAAKGENMGLVAVACCTAPHGPTRHLPARGPPVMRRAVVGSSRQARMRRMATKGNAVPTRISARRTAALRLAHPLREIPLHFRQLRHNPRDSLLPTSCPSGTRPRPKEPGVDRPVA
jgi:hypothetical protein